MNRTGRTALLVAAAGLAVALLTLGRGRPASVPAPPPIAGAGLAATVEDVGQREAQLKAKLEARPRPAPVSRNPFRFREEAPIRRGGSAAPPAGPALSTRHLEALPPPLTLAGIAERQGPRGGERIAIVSAPDGVHLVRAGERFSGRYEVVMVEKAAVQLRDLASQTAFTVRMR